MRSQSPRLWSCSYRSAAALASLTLFLALAGCGDTWRGAKKDTGENMQKTGETIEEAGEKVAN